MKQAVRVMILMFGLLGTYVAAAVPQVPTPDGGPILLCPPQQQQEQAKKCESGLPPMMR